LKKVTDAILSIPVNSDVAQHYLKEARMNISQIQSIARGKGIKPDKMKKQDLIRAIQRQEGAFECFATAYDGVCDQPVCAWRKDCFIAARKALSS
jgi:hypothetical protein